MASAKDSINSTFVKICSFKNTVIIMTSNIGARLITEKKTLGFRNSDNTQEYETTKREVLTELKKQFKKEFSNDKYYLPKYKYNYSALLRYDFSVEKISEIEKLSSTTGNENFDKAVCDEISTWTFEEADSKTTVTIPLRLR